MQLFVDSNLNILDCSINVLKSTLSRTLLGKWNIVKRHFKTNAYQVSQAYPNFYNHRNAKKITEPSEESR